MGVALYSIPPIVCVYTSARSGSDEDSVIGDIEEMGISEGVTWVGVACSGAVCVYTGEIEDHGFYNKQQ